MRRLIVFLCCLLFAGAAPVMAQERTPFRAPTISTPVAAGPQRTERIEAELVALSAWAAPGSTAVVAVRQIIEPGWHTYWRNPGNSGGATTLAWSLPAGVTAGEIVWPLPQRQRLQGLMNYGYSGEVLLPTAIQIPPDAQAGSSLPLTVKADFFVCSDEMCVPETLTLRLDIPIRAGAAPLERRWGRSIQKVLTDAPRPADIDGRVRLADGVLTLGLVGGPLPGAEIETAYFFPNRAGVIRHAAPQIGQQGARGLTLRMQASDDLIASGLTEPISGVLATNIGAFEVSATPGPAPAGADGGRALSTAEPATDAGGGWLGFLQVAGLALLGGLVLNLMPCVFPVLAMKAAALAGSAHEPRVARRDGFAFLAGVLTTFVGLASLMLVLRAGGEAVGWGFQLQSPGVIAALSLLMLAVGLNLSGVFHVGSGLQGLGSGPLARLSGPASAFFTGVLAVVVAAPCTAPFMAFALGAALVMPWPMALAVFAVLGLGMALPYLAVSLSPSLLKRLPRPGPWMERLKGLLAFPMYAAALWLVWVFSRQTGGDALAALLGAGLMLALAAWLYGAGQAARTAGAGGWAHLIGAIIALGAAVGLTVVAVRAPRETAAASQTALASQPWSSQAVADAVAQGRPVLVNFTADWCVTCKLNERAALGSARTAEALKATNAVYLVADWTRRDDAISAELQRHGRSGVPLYLVYSPGRPEPRILPQLLSEGAVIEALSERGS